MSEDHIDLLIVRGLERPGRTAYPDTSIKASSKARLRELLLCPLLFESLQSAVLYMCRECLPFLNS